jgi:hypothetical protein
MRVVTDKKTTDENNEEAHDVLAAEAFVVPAADPELEPAHDILAAEDYGVPGPDPDLHELHRHEPLNVPHDPHGDAEPHDVLAAEEFPMPAVHPHPKPSLVERRGGPARFAMEVAIVLSAIMALRRLLRGRREK